MNFMIKAMLCSGPWDNLPIPRTLHDEHPLRFSNTYYLFSLGIPTPVSATSK
jgi:hypothetical protein